MRDLDDMACELARRGRVVRLEPGCSGSGAPGGHLVVTRPCSSKWEFLVVRPRRHKVRVRVRTGQELEPLGTVTDVDELNELLRREIRGGGRPGGLGALGCDSRPRYQRPAAWL
ncbi:MAG: hypothetical protein JWO98_1248 [Frankiales bacterium]|nr:hypothetical protein [Frankiales bacterium]